MNSDKFSDIAPLEDHQVRDTIQELLVDPGFLHAVKYILPDVNWDEFSAEMSKYNTKFDFQSQMIAPTVWGLTRRTASSVESSGWESISKDKSNLFISNHRDIILDAGILNILLNSKGFETTEIAIGDNLLIHPWIEKLVKLNKSFLVKRGVSVRQMLEVSKHMSEYIHHTINEKRESVWLAQREGRAKDSNDRTQESLLKMLALWPETGSFIDRIKELNILPLSISYEFDPCDYLKAKEFQQKRDNPEYKKAQIDDLRNMEIGLLGFKGNIHFRLGKPINDKLDPIKLLDKKEQTAALAAVIDKEIHLNYEFYPCNYIAYDLLNNSDKFGNKYTDEQKNEFEEYLAKQIGKIDLENKDIPFLRIKLLEMYSNTLKNYLVAKGE
ncbi:1-acyl-sn-glycerol-3-phosphate acyltransferase [Dysgonomonas macrotermitis]|uniref:Acyltransferase n=1 Tax=Dysgonomonas macrotermitis TaxID=1346286 RepID=A0A1M5D175_9BACT|nr:1-acyl-sn-glycerol-3-phosphate acyltransferase [Dysgonomonas macrotermitis]SHF60567.1 Acyltransferase [Dysgonomonas macrotermitis]